MRNVRCVNELAGIDAATVGVLGFTAKDHTPRAIAVTPYVVEGTATVTTMLALLTKAQMLRNRPAAALYAGGTHVHGDVAVEMHDDPAWFDQHIRHQELAKYPPAKTLLTIPFHRRVLWWYVGRVAMVFELPTIIERPGSDRVTLTSVVDGGVQIIPLAADLDVDCVGVGDHVDLGAPAPDGPACLLVHHETAGMAELLSLTLRGSVRDGRLDVAERRGSVTPQHPGALDQLRSLRALAQSAKANRPIINAWAERTPTPSTNVTNVNGATP
ncbi:MAG: hypothetical protein AAFY28_00260 [Actinomycetota bacterium]